MNTYTGIRRHIPVDFAQVMHVGLGVIRATANRCIFRRVPAVNKLYAVHTQPICMNLNSFTSMQKHIENVFIGHMSIQLMRKYRSITQTLQGRHVFDTRPGTAIYFEEVAVAHVVEHDIEADEMKAGACQRGNFLAFVNPRLRPDPILRSLFEKRL